MSTWDDFFTGRKPSKAQVMAKINTAIKAGASSINIQWGENWLELMQQSNGIWCGFGWIKDIGGDDIAQELNKKYADKFVKDHFQFVHIR